MRKKPTANTNSMNWVYVEPDEQRWDNLEPATVSVDSLMSMRNGVFAAHGVEPYKGTMVGTLLYRVALDLDHAARLLKAQQGTARVVVTYTTKSATAAKRKAKAP